KIILRGLERDPARRFPDLEGLRRAMLPYLPGRLSFGGLAIRLAAYVIDTAVLLVLALLVTFALRASFVRFDNPNQIYENTRLRVCTATGVDPPGLARGLGRALAYYVLLDFGTAATVLLLPLARALGGGEPSPAAFGLLTLVSPAGVVVGAAIILSTMRKRNG